MKKLSSATHEVLQKHKVNYPVDVHAVAKALEIDVVEEALEVGVSGKIKKAVLNSYKIILNKSHSETRKRFTLAHDIGHCLLHADKVGSGIEEDSLLRSEGWNSIIEREANVFAADLLMPWELMDKAHEDGIKDTQALADAFHVSLAVMSIRLTGWANLEFKLDEPV